MTWLLPNRWGNRWRCVVGAVVSLILCACGDRGPSERYGFVATLGNDTVSMERVSRSSRKLVADGVDRFPLVRLRHTEFDLAPDGKLTRMVMDVRTPNGATPATRWRRVTARFTPQDVRIEVRDSAGVRDSAFATAGALTVPHVSMMYSVIDHEVRTALQLGKAAGLAACDSVLFRQFYPDRDVGPSFTLHRGYVHPLAGDKVDLRHDWLAGTGELTVDSAGRMLTYSGRRTTYLVAVKRTSDSLDVDALAARMVASEQRAGPNQLSVRDTARATIGGAELVVDYGRPLQRGRRLLGEVIPFGRVWRTGANAATQLITTAPITLGTVKLPAGTYTLWALPRADSVELIVNSQFGQWGTGYNRGRDLGRFRMLADTTSPPMEKFEIAVTPTQGKAGILTMRWGTFRWTAPLVVQ